MVPLSSKLSVRHRHPSLYFAVPPAHVGKTTNRSNGKTVLLLPPLAGNKLGDETNGMMLPVSNYFRTMQHNTKRASLTFT